MLDFGGLITSMSRPTKKESGEITTTMSIGHDQKVSQSKPDKRDMLYRKARVTVCRYVKTKILRSYTIKTKIEEVLLTCLDAVFQRNPQTDLLVSHADLFQRKIG